LSGEPERQERSARRARVPRRHVAWIVGAITLVAAGALLAQIDWRALDAHAIADRVRAAGAIGPLALFVLLIVQCVISPLPSEPLMMASGYLYGPWAGFALSWVSVVIGGTLCFLLARRLGRPVAERFAPRDKLDAFDAAFAGRGMMATFVAVLGIRLLAHGSFDIVSYACGLIPFSLPLFLLASGVGVVPKVFAFTYLGASAGARPGWLDAVLLVGTFGMLLLVPLWLRARRGATAPSAPDAG
jgi:uncharacterized membrane protein YdjX (TVP38/TMEM64 family)